VRNDDEKEHGRAGDTRQKKKQRGGKNQVTGCTRQLTRRTDTCRRANKRYHYHYYLSARTHARARTNARTRTRARSTLKPRARASTHTHTHTLSLSLTHPPTHTFSHSFSVCLSLSHTCTHTHTHTRTHAHMHVKRHTSTAPSTNAWPQRRMWPGLFHIGYMAVTYRKIRAFTRSNTALTTWPLAGTSQPFAGKSQGSAQTMVVTLHTLSTKHAGGKTTLSAQYKKALQELSLKTWFVTELFRLHSQHSTRRQHDYAPELIQKARGRSQVPAPDSPLGGARHVSSLSSE